jgi:hypothetical protein
MKPGFLVVVSFVAVCAAGARATAQDGGVPFQVNTFTTNQQRQPSVSADAGGGFIAAWQSATQDGADDAAIARAFLASGAPRTGEVQANTEPVGPQYEPAVAAVPDGGFFVVWTDGFVPGEDVWLRRFAANGLPLGVDLPVNTTTFATQRAPSIDADADGNVVVVWESRNNILDNNWTIFARRYNTAGLPLTGQIPVSQTTAGEQRRPVVALDPLGNFVVTWYALGRDGSGHAVLARLFDAAGNALGDEFLVNQSTAGDQWWPRVDRDAQGRFLVAWQDGTASQHGHDGSLAGIFARRFNAAGQALGDEFRVNTTTSWFQERPAAALAPDGRGMIVWQSGHEGDYGVFAQRYDASGAAFGTETRVNTVGPGHQLEPAVTAQPGGGFVVAWAQQQSGSTWHDVWARLYPAFGSGGSGDLIFEDGFESGDFSRWSAAVTDGTALQVTPAAAISGSFGKEGAVDDTAALYVQDDTPSDEPRYRARFHFDPNGFDPGEKSGRLRTRLFIAFEESPNRRLVSLILRRQLGQYAVMARVLQDDGTRLDTGFFAISDAPHAIEFDWVKATGDHTFDGRFDLWIDGVLVRTLTGIDNFGSSVDFARLGALTVKLGASGVINWDEFASRRQSYIGPAN